MHQYLFFRLEAPIGWRVMVTFKDLHLSPPSGDGPEKSCQTSYVKVSHFLCFIECVQSKTQRAQIYVRRK